MKFLKTLDIIVWVLLTVGGINWGLIGFFDFNLVAWIFGAMTVWSRIIYALVGLSALYEIFGVKSMVHRWDLQFRSARTA